MSMALEPVRDRVVTLAPRGRRRARPGERLLADALDRETRAPQGRVAVVVRLSRLPAPGPRPYDRRVARALLEDCAQRHGGQVIQLASGDLVLVTLPPAEPGRPAMEGPLALPGLLARLLHAEGEAGERLAFAVTLADGAAQLSALAEVSGTELNEEPAPRARNPFAGRLSPGFAPLAPDALERALAGEVAGMLQLHVTAQLPARGAAEVKGGGATQIRPVHRVLAPAPAAVAARLAAAHGGMDKPGMAPRGLDPSGPERSCRSIPGCASMSRRSWGGRCSACCAGPGAA